MPAALADRRSLLVLSPALPGGTAQRPMFTRPDRFPGKGPLADGDAGQGPLEKVTPCQPSESGDGR